MRLADGSRSPLLGHVILPITVAGLTRDIRVAIMPHLDADCYPGVNFVRAFRALLDPDKDQLLCKDAAASDHRARHPADKTAALSSVG